MRSEIILIVDDDPICLTLARLVLRHSGFTIQTAADGREALDLLQTLQPDLILSDIQMPNMDGFELARSIRQISSLCDIPMIALTAYATKEAERLAYDAGFTGYMTKPISSGALAANIRRYLEYSIAPCA